MIADGEAVVKIYPGAAQAFTILPGVKVAEEANGVITQFFREKLEANE